MADLQNISSPHRPIGSFQISPEIDLSLSQFIFCHLSTPCHGPTNDQCSECSCRGLVVTEYCVVSFSTESIVVCMHCADIELFLRAIATTSKKTQARGEQTHFCFRLQGLSCRYFILYSRLRRPRQGRLRDHHRRPRFYDDSLSRSASGAPRYYDDS